MIKLDILPFKQLLNNLKKAVSTRPILPILSCILLDMKENNLMAVATDLELTIVGNIETIDKIKEPVKIAIPYIPLSSFINKIDKEQILLLTVKNDKVVIKCGNNKIELKTMDSNDYPTYPISNREVSTELEVKNILPILENALTTVSHDNSKMTLSGIRIISKDNSIDIFSTDGFRCYFYKNYFDNAKLDMILPHKTGQELIKFIKQTQTEFISLEQKSNELIFTVSNYQISSKTISGTYPNYSAILPKNLEKKITVNRDKLKYAIELTSSICGEKVPVVSFNIKNNSMQVYINDNNYGESEDFLEINAENINENETISSKFNSKFFIDALSLFNTENVSIKLNSEKSPCVIEGDNNRGDLAIVMPIVR